MEDYSSGVWETTVRANVSDESLLEACRTDAPACVMVFEIQGGSSGPQADLHRSGGCRLCKMIESFATDELGVSDLSSYANGE